MLPDVKTILLFVGLFPRQMNASPFSCDFTLERCGRELAEEPISDEANQQCFRDEADVLTDEQIVPIKNCASICNTPSHKCWFYCRDFKFTGIPCGAATTAPIDVVSTVHLTFPPTKNSEFQVNITTTANKTSISAKIVPNAPARSLSDAQIAIIVISITIVLIAIAIGLSILHCKRNRQEDPSDVEMYGVKSTDDSEENKTMTLESQKALI